MMCRRCLHIFKRGERIRMTGKKRDTFRASVHALKSICDANLAPYKQKEQQEQPNRKEKRSAARSRT